MRVEMRRDKVEMLAGAWRERENLILVLPLDNRCQAGYITCCLSTISTRWRFPLNLASFFDGREGVEDVVAVFQDDLSPFLFPENLLSTV